MEVLMNTVVKLVEATKEEQAAAEYIELKAQEKKVAERLSELKKIIGPHLNAQADHKALFSGWEFTLSYSERENFKLSDAKKTLDLAILKPFITVSEISTIRTSFRGTDEKN
jgi:CRISPR/Cas system CMR-associated protein Cmr1 (group 7 of RAMP superfamily)